MSHLEFARRLGPIKFVCLLLAGSALLAMVASCSKEPAGPKKPKGPTATSHKSEETLDSALKDLKKGVDLEGCRTAIQQLNNYLASHADEIRALSAADKDALQRQFQLDQAELSEVENSFFTPLDAHHLEFCFIVHEALGKLRLDALRPVERATRGFAWAMRQVRLRHEGGPTLPPNFVLRRGWGSEVERALVVLAVFEQLGIEGSYVAVAGNSNAKGFPPFWVGGLIDKDIYLFDTRLGLPVPGAKSGAVATLAQVQEKPDLLRALVVDEKFPYDVDGAKLGEAKIYAAPSLSSLAPRMAYLQEVLSSTDKMHLAVKPAELLVHLQAAKKARGSAEVTVWIDPSSPLRVLRSFVPREEGGTDTKNRRDMARLQLVPFDQLPPALRDMPGMQIRQIYSFPFMFFDTETRMPEETLASWLSGLSKEANDKPGKKLPPEQLRNALPRDQEIRGRVGEATKSLTPIRSELERQVNLMGSPADRERLQAAVQDWKKAAIQVQAQLVQAQNAKNAQAVANANQQMGQLFANGGPAMILLQGKQAEAMLPRVVYLLALCKQEEAVQLTARGSKDAKGQWSVATGWWETFLRDSPNTVFAPAARLHRAEALEATGDTKAAVILLRDLTGDLSPLEKTARLYLAKRLESIAPGVK
jgi:hypothetical protein